MKKILNLTQHAPTQEQIEAGVIQSVAHSEIQRLLTFNSLPTREEITERAEDLAEIATGAQLLGGVDHVMIGGAPYLMRPLEEELLRRRITPLYAFSVRESVEEIQADGSVRKTQVFRHGGWVTAD